MKKNQIITLIVLVLVVLFLNNRERIIGLSTREQDQEVTSTICTKAEKMIPSSVSSQNVYQKHIMRLEKELHQNYRYSGFHMSNHNKQDCLKLLDCLDWSKYTITIKQGDNDDNYTIMVEIR